jgi:putative inorganic carbon (HCO3(-)) transporter
MNVEHSAPAAAYRAATPSLVALMSYILVMGGTWMGIMTRPTSVISVLILGGASSAWFIVRRRERWRWPRTALDPVLPLWLLAFLTSTLANLDEQQRIAVGLWFAGLYILAWYMLQDARANGALHPGALVDSLLVAAVVLPLGALVDLMLASERFTGFQGNANILGALLVMIVPLAAGRALAAQASRRSGWLVYLGLMVLVTWLSGSRGAWLGVLAAFGVVVLLRAPRAGLLIAIVAVPVGIALYLVRGAVGRDDLYAHALQLFAAAPFTGHGLFTFRLLDTSGTGVMHMHAHNVILHVAAELGIPGLVALAAMLWRLGLAAYRARGADAWPLAALVGVLVHQMVDFPLISPGVALCVIVVMGVAIPPQGQGTTAWPVPWLIALLAAVLCVAALVVGALPGILI